MYMYMYIWPSVWWLPSAPEMVMSDGIWMYVVYTHKIVQVVRWIYIYAYICAQYVYMQIHTECKCVCFPIVAFTAHTIWDVGRA